MRTGGFSNHSPKDLLLSLSQDGHPLEEYVEKFLELCHLLSWSDGTLKSCFWSGLDKHLLLASRSFHLHACTVHGLYAVAVWLAIHS
ncbi:hypothetical protein PO909_020615 [Leuciscus waleckii]